jgi:hypothetical protein
MRCVDFFIAGLAILLFLHGFASKVFSAYLCGSPRLCGNDSRKAYKPQPQRDRTDTASTFTSFDAVDVRLLRQSLPALIDACLPQNRTNVPVR